MKWKFAAFSTVCLLVYSNLQANTPVPAPPSIAAKSYVLMEVSTGDVIVEFNAHQRLAPASLTKIMTSYAVAAELESGRIGWADQVSVSIKAWKAIGSRMFIREGTFVPVVDLMRGVVVVSGNDASIALAEHVSGTEEAFADYMNEHAKLIGMENSNFKNSTGLDEKDHYSTAYDHALLTKSLIENYPTVYDVYSELEFTYGEISQPNRNTLLKRDPAVDGVKTGYTDDAGFNLVASAERDGLRLISVVLGTESARVRASESLKLLNYGFRNFTRHIAVEEGKKLDSAKVLFGMKDTVETAASETYNLLLVRGQEDELSVVPQLDDPLEAPITNGQEIGLLHVVVSGEIKKSIPLLATESIEEVGFFERIWQSLKLTFE